MADSPLQAYSVSYDLSNCDNEPIHLIRLVQAHACLIACRITDFKIIQVSDNSEVILDYTPTFLLNSNLQDILPKSVFELITKRVKEPDGFKLINPIRTIIGQKKQQVFHHLIAHININDILILEIEPLKKEIISSTYQLILGEAIYKVQKAPYEDIFNIMVEELKRITGYDRVMLYQFDEAYNGIVIAEAKEDFVEPYLGLRYPASDIPKQARDLYLKNKVRILVDTIKQPAQILPIVTEDNNSPLDLTNAVARGVSPIHLEYLSNMGVKGSFSVGIIVDDQLWGLIACHHYQPKFLDYRTRVSCQFLGQIFSGHLAVASASHHRESILKTNLIRARLFEQMSEEYNILKGLTGHSETIMDLIDCKGVAIITEQDTITIGQTPSEADISVLIEWLDERTNESVFETNRLPDIYEPAMAYKEVATGLLAIKFALHPNEFILWFRPEKIQEVFWGGSPKKSMIKKDGRISPRKSFSKWKELVNNTAQPWQKFELDAATDLRDDIKEFILQKFNEIRELNKKMQLAYEDLETFSYSVSHDLRSPIRNIEGFAQILKEDYTDKLEDFGLEIINSIIESTNKMSQLITDILDFSRLGKLSLSLVTLDTKALIAEVLKEVLPPTTPQKVEITIAPNLHPLFGDEALIRQMLVNILSNAIKYTRDQANPKIEISTIQKDEYTLMEIKDNGIGFDVKYASKIFEVFNRLVSEAEYEGTGIGLAIVHRIVEQHNGHIEVNSKPNEGASFLIRLPNSI